MTGTLRRTVLRAAGVAALGATGLTAGCVGGGRRTQVAVVWSDDELSRFRAVVAGYTRATGQAIEVISTGDDIDAFISARRRAGTAPDVAVLPRPGLVTDYARRGWLRPLPERLAGGVPASWAKLLRVDGQLYGAWVKAAHKSLIWYQPSLIGAPPGTWQQLRAIVRGYRAAHPGGAAPLAVGAADGWVVTDWFENVLAGLAPADLYDRLAAGEPRWDAAPVRQALHLLADLWSTPDAFPGGGQRALLTQFDESVIEVTSGRAAMVFEADFAQTMVDAFQEPGRTPVAAVRFPAIDGRYPLVAGGDAAVVLAKEGGGSPVGDDLVAWLTRPGAFASWIAAGGYLSPDPSVPLSSYPPGLARTLAAQLRTSPDLRFDLSDQLPGAFGGADGVGSWRILDDFFQAVTTGSRRLDAAVTHTIAQLNQAARDAGGGL